MGRHAIYATEEERKEAQRKHALKYYYRRKALKQLQQQQESHSDDPNERINVKVTVHSKTLGDIDEDVQYKTTAKGGLMKVRTKKRNSDE